jgi:hypothetical protein
MRVIAKGYFMNHPDIERKIPAALREAVPLVASGVIKLPQKAIAECASNRFSSALKFCRCAKYFVNLAGLRGIELPEDDSPNSHQLLEKGPTTLSAFTPIRQVFQSDGQNAILRFESSQPSHRVRSRAGLFRRWTPAKRP